MTSHSVTARRAYFDCRYGQLHVRTAFPGTGGFDEHTTVLCVHSVATSSRVFVAVLAQLAQNRSVYAPDRPGHGESDLNAVAETDDARTAGASSGVSGASAADGGVRAALQGANAVEDLARDLRLRQIDLLALDDGAEIALRLAAARTDLVRRLVLIGAVASHHPTLQQPCLPIQIAANALQSSWPQVVGKIRPFFDAR